MPPIDQFRQNIARVQTLLGTYSALEPQITAALDLSDILRATLVLSVSAFDHLVHEVVRTGMLEVYAGTRLETPSFRRFDVSIDSVRRATSSGNNLDWFDAEVRARHAFQTFQRPDRVADAIRLISSVEMWPVIAQSIGATPEDVRRQLDLIVTRRNQIAHEADMDPAFPGTRWPIAEADVGDAISFLSLVGETLVTVT